MKAAFRTTYKASSTASEAEAFRLGDVDVLPASGNIRGPGGARKLDPKVMDVLLRLSAADGEVVSRDTLMADVWGDIVVTDFALSRCIYQLRKNLQIISEEKESAIKTHPKRGYKLVWPLEKPGLEPSRKNIKPMLGWLALSFLILGTAAVLVFQDRVPNRHSEEHLAIAVMPFMDLTVEENLGHVGDGIAQTLISELGHIKEIDVIGRSSSFSLKDAGMSLEELAVALGVRYLVEGSVSRELDTLHVSAALIDARDGHQLWARTFQSVAGQSFSVQQEIASEIAGYLQVSIGDPHKHGGTNNYQAFEAYLRASEADDPEVASLFIDEALAHDRNYARALVAKAHIAYERLWDGIGSEEGTWQEVQPLLEEALSITEELPYAHVLIAGFQMKREDYDPAEQALKRALEINPSHIDAFVHLSRLMEKKGRYQEAVVLAERNVRLDPLNPSRHVQLANRLWTAGDTEAGKASFERALEIDPYNHEVWWAYAIRLGDLESPVSGFRLVARLQKDPQFRSQFFGPFPGLPPACVQLFGLWFGFMDNYEREREMLKLQSQMADNARLHRELAWAMIGEGDLNGAREEAWIGLRGMPRESIVNFQIAYIALQTGQGLEDVLNHYQGQWPELFEEPPDLEFIPEELVIGPALIYRALGDEPRAIRMLNLLKEEGHDPFAATAMALANLGEIDEAIEALSTHIDKGGFFNYLPGDPFWAPLAADNRFLSITDTHREQATAYRVEVEGMIEKGELVLPGQLDYHASKQVYQPE